MTPRGRRSVNARPFVKDSSSANHCADGFAGDSYAADKSDDAMLIVGKNIHLLKRQEAHRLVCESKYEESGGSGVSYDSRDSECEQSSNDEYDTPAPATVSNPDLRGAGSELSEDRCTLTNSERVSLDGVPVSGAQPAAHSSESFLTTPNQGDECGVYQTDCHSAERAGELAAQALDGAEGIKKSSITEEITLAGPCGASMEDSSETATNALAISSIFQNLDLEDVENLGFGDTDDPSRQSNHACLLLFFF